MASELHRLNQVDVGEAVRLEVIDGDHQLIRKLLGLGIRVGARLTVTQRRGAGVVVANQGSRVALGPGLADRLQVILDSAET